MPPLPIRATRNSFVCNWNRVSGAIGYRLDISTDSSFSSYVTGYRDLDVGNTNSRVINNLKPGTLYYYRVRAYSQAGISTDSAVMRAQTAAGAGLVIVPTFDASIEQNANAVAIKAMINQAITVLENNFKDAVAVSIYFRYAPTELDGVTPLPSGALAVSDLVAVGIDWNTFITALTFDATTGYDISANASLPSTPLSALVFPSTANGRAIGLNTAPLLNPDGSLGGSFDGIITLNSNVTFKFTRPPSAGFFDAQRTIEHEMDEILGLGSSLPVPPATEVRPQDLFSWSAPNTRNNTVTGTRYFSVNGGVTNIINFNQNAGGDFGDWQSGNCPQGTNAFVQNAFACAGEASDVSSASPEGINLDVIGYDLNITATPTPTPTPSVSPTATPRPTPTPTPVPLNPYAVMVSPPDGSTLPSKPVTFSWMGGNASTAYWLQVGNSLDAGDIFSSGQTGDLFATVTNIPEDGRTVYVTLRSLIGGKWYFPPQRYTYTSFPGQVLTPVIAPKPGKYLRKVIVSIGSATPGSTIRYTLDGTTPSSISTLYSAAFTIKTKGTITVLAKAFKSGVPDSAVASATYTIK